MGQLKGMLRIWGVPILQYVLDRLDWPGAKWLVTAPGREGPPGFERFDRELVDAEVGLGPLGGVLTALNALDRGMLLVTTVDMPAVERAQLQWIAGQLAERPEHLGVMCRRIVAGREQIEPFPLALRAEARSMLRQRLQAGRRAVHQLVDDSAFVVLDAPPDWDDFAWANLNRPRDLEEFERKTKGQA